MSEALIDRWRRLRGQVKGHKAAIRRHREELARDAEQLAAIERECRERGIALHSTVDSPSASAA